MWGGENKTLTRMSWTYNLVSLGFNIVNMIMVCILFVLMRGIRKFEPEQHQGLAIWCIIFFVAFGMTLQFVYVVLQISLSTFMFYEDFPNSKSPFAKGVAVNVIVVMIHGWMHFLQLFFWIFVQMAIIIVYKNYSVSYVLASQEIEWKFAQRQRAKKEEEMKERHIEDLDGKP